MPIVASWQTLARGANTAGGITSALPLLPGQTAQCLPPANLLTLPSQPGHHAQPKSRQYAHSYTLTQPGLASRSAAPAPLPAALPDWPLTEPKNPLHFAATLPPTVPESCLVNLDSIQLQNLSEYQNWITGGKNYASQCLNIKCGNTRPPAAMRSWLKCSNRQRKGLTICDISTLKCLKITINNNNKIFVLWFIDLSANILSQFFQQSLSSENWVIIVKVTVHFILLFVANFKRNNTQRAREEVSKHY